MNLTKSVCWLGSRGSRVRAALWALTGQQSPCFYESICSKTRHQGIGLRCVWFHVSIGGYPQLNRDLWPRSSLSTGLGAAPSGLLGAIPTFGTDVVPFVAHIVTAENRRSSTVKQIHCALIWAVNRRVRLWFCDCWSDVVCRCVCIPAHLQVLQTQWHSLYSSSDEGHLRAWLSHCWGPWPAGHHQHITPVAPCLRDLRGNMSFWLDVKFDDSTLCVLVYTPNQKRLSQEFITHDESLSFICRPASDRNH